MAEERVQRRLAAILTADVVGYSRLVRADEEDTLAVVGSLISEVIQQAVEAHRGRIFKKMGDAVLAEFSSTVEAVRCAIAVQHEIADRGSGTAPQRRITFRIGLHVGDVVVDGDDIHGDGVNVAARIEGLAAPDGICISEDVFRQVEGRIEAGFEDIGPQRLKNIDSPIRVYRVRPDAARQGRAFTPVATRLRRLKWPAAALAGVIVALVIARQFGVFPIREAAPELDPASVERMAFPLPDKPSIAVLPFANLSGDTEQDYFADGMTDDLITDLSKISGLFVISRNSVFAYKGKSVKIAKVAEELGVRYVLEGSVRRAGNQVRVNAQLIDATTGGHLWAERYDGALTDVFALQDAVAGKVVEALELHLTKSDTDRRNEGTGTGNVESYDLVLKARKLLTRFDRKAATEARKLLERAIGIDPDYTESYSLLGLYYFDAWRLWGENPDRNLLRALELSKNGIRLSPHDPAPHVLSAQVHQFRREFDAANVAADAALKLEPNDAITLANLGSMLRYAHRADEAAKVVERAIRLDPFHPPNYLEWLGDAYFLLGRHDDCVRAAERGVALDPEFVALHVVSAKCYAALEMKQKARKSVAGILRINPGFTLRAFASYVPFTDRRDLQRNIEMLRKAGLPE